MNRIDWRTVSIETIIANSSDIGRKLFPVLHNQNLSQDFSPEAYGESLVRKCKEGLQRVFPLTPKEKKFLDSLLDKGIIDPTLLTSDSTLQRRIMDQPLLQWKALNVKKHRGLT